MKQHLMISAAALALIAGTSLATAQGMNREPSGGAAGGAAAQEHGSTGASSGAKATEQKSPEAGQRQQRTEEKTQGQKSKSMSSRNETQNKAEGREGRDNKLKAEGREGRDNNMKVEGREGRDNNIKAEGREGRDNNMKAEGREGRNGNTNAETKSGTDAKSQTTVGQAGGAKLSSEQRTKITTVIRDQHVAPANNVNFSITVGTRVPREGVTLHALPAAVVTIYPEWRGYEFIQVRDQILVIDPATHEIVAILEA